MKKEENPKEKISLNAKRMNSNFFQREKRSIQQSNLKFYDMISHFYAFNQKWFRGGMKFTVKGTTMDTTIIKRF